ncbi:MAG: tyrosine recombinase [Dehalococcoidia bacterium]|nr:tyrosine recombinase [Dehalococcoidia bacterium]MEC9450927.1 site-specific tyrosine recombinase/integron integrase [Chloroflexota bacterium]|tara:strand:- start:2560 stop:3456 length:897 start_codon:yes stop_codon:yes gene_type:complete
MNKFKLLIEEFLDSNTIEKGNSENTKNAYKNDLNQFNSWVKSKNIPYSEIRESQIEKYLLFLGKRGYEKSTISRKTACLKAFFKFLLKENVYKKNIMDKISRPAKKNLLPKSLSRNEINKIFNYLESSNSKNNYRDKAIIEILYGCGLRISELISLNTHDINFEESTIQCTGKGNKQRIIPTNDSCLKAIDDYIQIERSQIKVSSGNQALLVNRNGSRITRQTAWNSIKSIINKLKLDSEITPHTFRHTFATDLLKGGANLRQVQEMLGHSSLSATQIYTMLDNEWIKKEFLASHPRA